LQQNAFAFGGGEFPFAAAGLVEGGSAASRSLFRIVADKPVAVPIEQILVRAD
jgi:hypothetical protein